jgi:hypothetical protein
VNFPLFFALCGNELAASSAEIGYYAAACAVAVTFALVLLSVYRRDFAWTPIYGLLLLLHPAWTVPVDRGDCGDAMRFLAVTASLVLVAILVCQVFWPHLSRRRFLLALYFLLWALYLVNWPLYVLLAERLGSSNPDGFVAQVFFSFLAAENYLLLVALALTLVCFLAAIANVKYRNRCMPLTDAEERSPADEMTGQGRHMLGLESDVPSRSHRRHFRLCLSMLALTLLLILALPYVFSPAPVFGGNPPYSIITITWCVLLMVSAARGRFPGLR